MPWTAPKSLSTSEVYAVTAYLLNLAGVVAEDFTLSDRNIAEVQQRMPNRDGMTTEHGLWPGRSLGNGGKPDVHVAACMTDCATEPKVASFLPDFARNAHGNLADQNRLVGAQHGADTTRPPGAAPAASPAQPARAAEPAVAPAVALAREHQCLNCHAMDRKVVGPAFDDVARKYRNHADATGYLAKKIRIGGSGVWGVVPMPPQTLPEADVQTLAQWLADGAAR
jgi:cytochrome c